MILPSQRSRRMAGSERGLPISGRDAAAGTPWLGNSAAGLWATSGWYCFLLLLSRCFLYNKLCSASNIWRWKMETMWFEGKERPRRLMMLLLFWEEICCKNLVKLHVSANSKDCQAIQTPPPAPNASFTFSVSLQRGSPLKKIMGVFVP